MSRPVDAVLEDIHLERVEFSRRARIIITAEADGLLDYLTCPACHALVPIHAGTWPDQCPRCHRCV